MNESIQTYHDFLQGEDREIAGLLYEEISCQLPEAEGKKWHGHPVWFLNGNPVVGYSKRKEGVNLMFWSGQSFDEPLLKKEGKFKAAEVCYIAAREVNSIDLKRWLNKARDIQWDYKNIVKRKGVLERLK